MEILDDLMVINSKISENKENSMTKDLLITLDRK